MLGLKLNHVSKKGHRGPFYMHWHGLNLIPAWILEVIISIAICGMGLFIYSQTVQPLRFGNGYIISSCILLGMWLVIHMGLLCNSPETGEFPAKMASNAGNVSIWWRHHDVGVVEWVLAHVNFLTAGLYKTCQAPRDPVHYIFSTRLVTIHLKISSY